MNCKEKEMEQMGKTWVIENFNNIFPKAEFPQYADIDPLNLTDTDTFDPFCPVDFVDDIHNPTFAIEIKNCYLTFEAQFPVIKKYGHGLHASKLRGMTLYTISHPMLRPERVLYLTIFSDCTHINTLADSIRKTEELFIIYPDLNHIITHTDERYRQIMGKQTTIFDTPCIFDKAKEIPGKILCRRTSNNKACRGQETPDFPYYSILNIAPEFKKQF